MSLLYLALVVFLAAAANGLPSIVVFNQTTSVLFYGCRLVDDRFLHVYIHSDLDDGRVVFAETVNREHNALVVPLELYAILPYVPLDIPFELSPVSCKQRRTITRAVMDGFPPIMFVCDFTEYVDVIQSVFFYDGEIKFGITKQKSDARSMIEFTLHEVTASKTNMYNKAVGLLKPYWSRPSFFEDDMYAWPAPAEGFALCVGGVDKQSVSHLREFVEHQLSTTQGVDHIVIGYEGDDVEALSGLLAEHRNQLTIFDSRLPPQLFKSFHHASWKLHFYNWCLSHAKYELRSDWAGVMEMDPHVNTSAPIVLAVKIFLHVLANVN